MNNFQYFLKGTQTVHLGLVQFTQWDIIRFVDLQSGSVQPFFSGHF